MTTRKKAKTTRKAPARKVSAKTTNKRRKGAPSVKVGEGPPAQPVTVTLRLPSDLVSQLRTVATERRNAYAPPYTQGGIMEVAVREWLKRNS